MCWKYAPISNSWNKTVYLNHFSLSVGLTVESGQQIGSTEVTNYVPDNI